MTNQPLFFRDNGKLKKIDSDEIVVLSALGNYVQFFTTRGMLAIRTTLNNVLNLLPPKQFLQVHRTYAVSVHYVTEISRDEVIVTGVEGSIPISKQHYAELIRQLTIIGALVPEEKKNLPV
jgi:DNA-binding LytR/AlgR family response regulator